MYFGKEIRIILKGDAEKAYLELKRRNDKEAKSILNYFNRIKEILKKNPQYGDPVKKELIPSKFK